MAQFDVHRNVANRRAGVPYLVIVQSRLWDSAGTRLVVPLISATGAPGEATRLTPLFVVEGMPLSANPLLMFATLPRQLGPYVTHLDEADGERMIAAIDEAISRAYG